MKTFRDWLISKGACAEGFKAHARQTEQEFWSTCNRADWMLWVAERKYGEVGWPDHRAFVKIACLCAIEVLVYLPAGENRPRLAIEAAARWVDNPSDAAKDAAGDAAGAAAGDAAWAAAGDAAWAARAAAWAAWAAGDAAGAAAWAAWAAKAAAGAAAWAAAGDAAWAAENKKQADFIRKIWPSVGNIKAV